MHALSAFLSLLPFVSGLAAAQSGFVNAAQAQKILAAAAAQASASGVPSNIAVTDPYGYLVGFLRTDGAMLASIEIAIKKAKTVALFNGQFTTGDLFSLTQPGAMLNGIQDTNGGLVVFGGGVPIMNGNVFVGAIGASGGTPDQDVSVASAGAKAFTPGQ